MKKLIGILICLILAAAAAVAFADVAIDRTNFPDRNFREYVKAFDEDQNGDKYSTSWKKQMLDFIAEE